MSVELEFSVQLPSADLIQPLLDEFEAKQHIHVKLRLLSWDTAWGELVKVGLYNEGPDLSELGNTWLGDIAAMNALHVFTPDEIALLGKASAFLPAAWQACQPTGISGVHAIPWLVGARLIFYRRELLQRAGIDEETAFTTAAQIEETLRQLQAHGIVIPWTVPTGQTHTTLLNLASWVWAAGGDFVSPDGKQVLIAEPATIVGLRNYFALGRYVAPQVLRLNALQPDGWFLQHADTAATISGPWQFHAMTPDQHAQLGLALPLGLPLLGGSHLVIWKHSRKQEAALKLIRFLTQPEVQIRYAQRVGLLPAVVEALDDELYQTDRLWRMAAQAVQAGRAAPVVRSWGLMEDRLATEFAAIWAEFLPQPTLDLVTLLTRHLEPLAKRFNQILAQ